MVKGYIYRHWLINDKGIEKSYIGQTINELEIRWQNGLGYTTIDSKFSKAIKKYGWNNFHHDVIETVECKTKEELKDVLNSLEKAYIETYDSFYNGYNSTTGGEGYIVSDETKNKMSESADKRTVVCLNNGLVFTSAQKAYWYVRGTKDVLGTGGIANCCLGYCNYYGQDKETGENLVWVYYEDYKKMTADEIDAKLSYKTKTVETVSINTIPNTYINKEIDVHNEVFGEGLEKVYEILSDKQAMVFEEYFLNGDTMEVIAKRHNVSKTRIGNLTKQIVKKITEQYTVKEFANLLK